MGEDLIVIGVDAHKRTHTLVATDRVGRRLAETTVAATTDGHLVALEWASGWPTRKWAVEDCRHLTRTLERDLLRAGERVVRVPTKLMSGARRAAREAGKSDPTRSRSLARPGVSPTYRPRVSMGRSASCGCSSTIATTWCVSGRASRAGSVGICTSSSRRSRCARAVFAANLSSTG